MITHRHGTVIAALEETGESRNEGMDATRVLDGIWRSVYWISLILAWWTCLWRRWRGIRRRASIQSLRLISCGSSLTFHWTSIVRFHRLWSESWEKERVARDFSIRFVDKPMQMTGDRSSKEKIRFGRMKLRRHDLRGKFHFRSIVKYRWRKAKASDRTSKFWRWMHTKRGKRNFFVSLHTNEIEDELHEQMSLISRSVFLPR